MNADLQIREICELFPNTWHSICTTNKSLAKRGAVHAHKGMTLS